MDISRPYLARSISRLSKPERRIVRPTRTWRQRWSPVSRSLLLCLLLGFGSTVATGQSLRGSRASLDVQVSQAERHDFTYLRSPVQVRQFVDAGLLVPVHGNHDYTLKDVSFPFGRPEVKLFIERLSEQYRQACGERLVITSLTRPKSKQPRNASDRSVHPTGMAIDLRRPRGTCRRWLEGTLLYLEEQGVLEGTAERSPPHYHVALFPSHYAAYVERMGETGAGSAPQPRVYTVRRGDSLWDIAQRHGASVSALRRANGLTSTRIYPGQSLDVSVGPW